ncbi:MAG: tetratricopeptide repeat protein [Rhodobacteraceae bacterium]|uniref:tetratricopeptide repeat protein n=1 Tax=Albidovulum sp. TaxID=1872424 RepID=UPI001D68B560|nr:tetratricopeptide repeat protein [uncultured Defluviimonas sp.]MCB2126818.1 tetratricopeptide repeat protein [Paracoccaceae bacterium]MCC0070283.1 tetratricopeptide repeat protein [Paracoccaceae bacterium]
MSETDSFIDEVTEEVRRDKLFAVFRKYGWIGVLAVLLIVGGAAFNEWQKARVRSAAEGFGDAVVAAMDTEDPAARVAALDAISTGGGGEPAARRAVTQFLAADEALKAGDRAGALNRLEALAAEPGLPDDYRQLARLKAVILAGASMDAAARDAALAELAQPGAPFRALAMEQQAVALTADGKTDEALALARQVLQEPDATPGLQRRVTQLIVALGGDPDAG